MYKLLLFIEKITAYIILSFLRLTLRYRISGLAKPYPRAVYVFWNRNIIALLLNRRNEKNVVIISSSKDGDYIAEPAKMFGYITVRGSSSRQGSTALKEMVKLSRAHSLALTPDGPKGPTQKLKDGALQLAYLTKLPLHAVKVDVSKAWVFNSWDRFVVPKPFAHITVQYSEPYMISNKEEFEQKREEIQDWMNG